MPNVDPLDRDDLADFEAQFQMVESAMGFVPTSLLTMAHRPALLRTFFQLSGTILGPSRLDGALKQLVAHVASSAAGCRYCQAHTGSSARRQGADDEKIQSAWEFETSDLFDDAERAALRLARDASLVPNASTPEHFAALREHFDEEEIVELVSVISLFGYLNRWNDTMATTLEEEPRDFGEHVLGLNGWSAGKHGSTS